MEVHGILPTEEQLNDEFFPAEYSGIVLYGDMAPKYYDAQKMVKNLRYSASYFVIVGTSFYTGISDTLHKLAQKRKARIIIINEDASTKVPEVCDMLKRRFGDKMIEYSHDEEESVESIPCPYAGGWESP